MIGAFGLTEPHAGSDAGGTKTFAYKDGDQWVINGSKLYMTSGRIAGVMVITAKTDKEATGSRAINSFIIENPTDGLSFGKDEDKMGCARLSPRPSSSRTCAWATTRCLARLASVSGSSSRYWTAGASPSVAMAVGLGQAAFEAALRYSNERQQFGQPISNFQAVQFMLADMAMKLDAARLLVYHPPG